MPRGNMMFIATNVYHAGPARTVRAPSHARGERHHQRRRAHRAGACSTRRISGAVLRVAQLPIRARAVPNRSTRGGFPAARSDDGEARFALFSRDASRRRTLRGSGPGNAGRRQMKSCTSVTRPVARQLRNSVESFECRRRASRTRSAQHARQSIGFGHFTSPAEPAVMAWSKVAARRSMAHAPPPALRPRKRGCGRRARGRPEGRGPRAAAPASETAGLPGAGAGARSQRR